MSTQIYNPEPIKKVLRAVYAGAEAEKGFDGLADSTERVMGSLALEPIVSLHTTIEMAQARQARQTA